MSFPVAALRLGARLLHFLFSASFHFHGNLALDGAALDVRLDRSSRICGAGIQLPCR